MQERNQLIRLDWVLHYMAENAYDGLETEPAWKGILEKYPSIHQNDPSYRHQLFQQLIDDGYLKFNEHGDNRNWITLRGLRFSDYGNGGYVNALKKDALKMKSQNLKDWSLIVASSLAGAGAILYFCLEVYKFLCS